MGKFTGTEEGFFVAVLKTSGAVQVFRFDVPELRLEFLQMQVGGFVEIVRAADFPSVYIVCNEDGLRLRLPLNIAASLLYSRGVYRLVGDVVVGCDFDARSPFAEPDIYACPAPFLRSVLADLHLLERSELMPTP